MNHGYRFGEYRLLPARRELWRGDAMVAVPPRAFDCIVYLVEQRERAVGRDELIAAVWGKTDLSDGLLAQTILAMRRAFDDTGKEQNYIRTVVRFGYHWVAPTRELADTDSPGGNQATAAAQAPLRGSGGDMAGPDLPSSDDGAGAAEQAPHCKGASDVLEPGSPDSNGTSDLKAAERTPLHARRARLVAMVLVTLALLVAGTWRYLDVSRRAPLVAATTAEAPILTALVLPVDSVAGEGSDWIRLGLMDHIAARLRAAGLAVVPSDNVVVLTGATARKLHGNDASALAQAAGANLVIDARAERVETRWHVHLRTKSGRTPPVESDGEAGDALVAARIAADLLARDLGYAPQATTTGDASPLDGLLQQAEAAILGDRLDDARALLARAPAEQRALPVVRLRLAQIDYQAGDFDAAEAAFKAIADEVPAERDRVVHARAITNLGVIAAMRNNNVLAAERFDEAIALLRGQGVPDALGKALNGRANVAGAMDQIELSLQAFAQARVAFESSGNLLALALIDSNLAALDMRRERFAEAVPMFRRAADRFATFGVHAAEQNALMGIAELQLALLEPDAALTLEPRLRDLSTLVADPARQRNGELTRLYVLVANGRSKDVPERVAGVLDSAMREDDAIAQARAHALLGRLALERSDARLAQDEAAKALARFGAVDDAREFARTYILRIDALLAGGELAEAAKVTEELSTFAARNGSSAARLYADLARARTTTDADAAGTWYARALAEADALRIPLDLREVAVAYAAWLIARGEHGRAGALAERVAGFAERDFGSALLQVQVQQAIGNEALWRSALARAQALAGDRPIPPALSRPTATN
ncbi:winged helix-turn-helix domain-containing protein [Dokdonella sp.]|uniref:winged helix-turn-helix domain-containing protein n=1 Tax=Dokdonella sp. TaxID=2291710 RepID=UPI0037842E90